MTDEVKQPVDEQKLDLVFERPRERIGCHPQFLRDAIAVGRALDQALGILEVDDDVPERHPWKHWLARLEHREREHVGRVVLTAPLQIERLNKRIIA